MSCIFCCPLKGLNVLIVLKPEDIVKELMENKQQQQLIIDDYDKIDEADSNNLDQEEDVDDDEDDDDDGDGSGGDDDESQARKLNYKIEFHRQTTASTNGGGNGTSSFLAMVQ